MICLVQIDFAWSNEPCSMLHPGSFKLSWSEIWAWPSSAPACSNFCQVFLYSWYSLYSLSDSSNHTEDLIHFFLTKVLLTCIQLLKLPKLSNLRCYYHYNYHVNFLPRIFINFFCIYLHSTSCAKLKVFHTLLLRLVT